MEGTQPAIGESSKVKSILDLLNIAKILALVFGILGFLIAAWSAWPVIYGYWGSIIGGLYWIVAAVINLMLYMRMDEFSSMVKARRYVELHDTILIWMVLGLIFGFIVGLLLLIVFIQLDELKKAVAYPPTYPPQSPPSVPPPPE